MKPRLFILAIAIALTSCLSSVAAEVTTPDVWTVHVRVQEHLGRMVDITVKGTGEIEATLTSPFTPAPANPHWAATLDSTTLSHLREITEEAIRNIDLNSAQSRITGGLAIVITLEAGTVTLTTSVWGLEEIEQAGPQVSSLLQMLNGRLPTDFVLR